MAKPSPGPIAKAAVVVASVLAGLALLLTLVFVAIDLDAVADRAKSYLQTRTSDALGRNVSVQTVGASLLPKPHIALGNMLIHGRTGEPPLMEIEAVDVDLAFWPLLRSFGREIRIKRVKLARAEVNALRDRQGQWNFEGLGSGGEEKPPRDVSIRWITLEDGTLRIIDRSGPRGEATVALTDIDLDVENVAPAQPMRVQGGAAFASERRNLFLELNLSSLPSSIAKLRPGAWPTLTGNLRLEGAELTRLEGLLPAKLAGVLQGGEIRLDAELSTTEGTYIVDGAAILDALLVRGAPTNGSLHLRARVDPAHPRNSRAEMDRLAVKGPGIDLSGSASFVASPAQFQFALRGALLDLRSILGVVPEVASEDPTGSRTAVLPEQIRRTIEGVALRGSLEVDRVVSGSLEATELSALALLQSGVLRLEKAEARIYSGRADASGTTVNLLDPLPRWHLQVRLSEMDAAAAMSAVSGSSPLKGKVDAWVDLHGRGSDWEHVRTSMTGAGVLALKEGVFTTMDLGRAAALAATAALALGRSEVAEIARRTAGETDLRDLTASFTVHEGWLDLREPLVFTSSIGAGRLQGQVGLDLSLALRGSVVASREFLTGALSGTGVRPTSPVEVPVLMGGTLRSPTLEVNERAVAHQLASGWERQHARKIEESVKRQARRRIDDFSERHPSGARP